MLFRSEVSVHDKEGSKAFGLYHRTGQNPGKTVAAADDKDNIRNALRGLKLLGTKSGNKFIPHSYKTASRQDRLELLAGLIDTDGHYDSRNNKYEYCSKSEQLAQDFAFIARSLGMNVSISGKLINEELYQQVYLNGTHIKDIPSRLERKRARAST